MIMEFLQKLAYAVITAAVPVLTVYLCNWLRSLNIANKEKVGNEKVQLVLNNVTDMVISAVITTTNTYVKELKAENLFDKDAQLIAFNKTKEAVMAQITEDSAAIIESVYADIDVYITNLIERYVEELKG
jgi:hypothetical protein